jgi:hypothetical protein
LVGTFASLDTGHRAMRTFYDKKLADLPIIELLPVLTGIAQFFPNASMFRSYCWPIIWPIIRPVRKALGHHALIFTGWSLSRFNHRSTLLR